MKAFSVIILIPTLSLLLIISNPVAAIPKTYLTVKHGSPATLMCEFSKPNPQQVLWVRGKLGLMSLDGEDFFTIARTLDPKLDRNYRLESVEVVNDTKVIGSKLIIDTTDIDNEDHANPYKCVVDIINEKKYLLAIVKDDLKCSFANNDGPFRVGDTVDVECSVTKDRSGAGKLDFFLLVGHETIDTQVVHGTAMWKDGTNIARPRFSFVLREKFHGKEVRVELNITNGDNLEAVVDGSLSLSYGLNLNCSSSQHFVKTSMNATKFDGIPYQAIKDEDESDDNQSELPLPHCFVEAAAPLESERSVIWQFVGSEEEKHSRSHMLGSRMVSTPDSRGKTIYRTALPRSYLNSLTKFPQKDVRLTVSISDLDSSSSQKTIDVDIHLAPQIRCFDFQGPAVKLGSNKTPIKQGKGCQILSCPPINDVQVTADASVKLLRPQLMTFSRDDSDESQSFSTPFTITFPEASEVDADDFVREFASLHGVRGDSVPWVGRTVQDPPSFVETVPTSAVIEEENDVTLTDGGNDQSAEAVAEPRPEEVSSVNGEVHSDPQEHDGQEEEVKQVEDDASDAVAEPGREKRKANFNVVRSRVRRHEGHQHDGEEHQHDGEEPQQQMEERQHGEDAAQHDGDHHGGEEHQHGNDEHSNEAVRRSGPVGKVSPVQYEPLSLPNKDELAAYFHAKALYRVGNFQRMYDFHLPAFRLSYDSSLNCDNSVAPSTANFEFSCSLVAIPVIDLNSVSVFAESESFAAGIQGRIKRTARGFDVTGSYGGVLEGIVLKRFDIIVRVSRSGGKWEDARIQIDFSHLTLPRSDDADGSDPTTMGSKSHGKHEDHSDHSGHDPTKGQSHHEHQKGDDTKGQSHHEHQKGDDKSKGMQADPEKVQQEVGFKAEGDRGKEGVMGASAGDVTSQKWFLPVVGSVGGVTVIIVAVAIFVGVKSRGRGRTARMDQHRVGLPDEHHDGYSAANNSVAPSDDNEGGVNEDGPANDEDGNNENNNNSCNLSKEEMEVAPDGLSEIAEFDSPYTTPLTMNGDTSLIVPDEPPVKIQRASPIKAMQSFPVGRNLTGSMKVAPYPNEEV